MAKKGVAVRLPHALYFSRLADYQWQFRNSCGGLNAKENEPICAQENGPIRCAVGWKIDRELMRKILVAPET